MFLLPSKIYRPSHSPVIGLQGAKDLLLLIQRGRKNRSKMNAAIQTSLFRTTNLIHN